ncbi:hypothetical protein DSL92_06260 [Billgrantia gudaonensis]|uniref:FlgO domain-containing protein n=1 Tax=Billgrantia gudaonensis TaxID=376427 RepID=A0A3S0NEQ7_9GAMM|nr:hypothetical protein DSL92_06260 [Halomonas gudaonensis]
MSRIAVREVKMRDSLFIEERIGEPTLSGSTALTQAHDARSILMGTYAEGQTRLYQRTIVRASDAMVLGSASLAVPLDNNLRYAGRWMVTARSMMTCAGEHSSDATERGCPQFLI